MNEIIRLEHVSMAFRMDLNRTTSLKEWMVTLLKGHDVVESLVGEMVHGVRREAADDSV